MKETEKDSNSQREEREESRHLDDRCHRVCEKMKRENGAGLEHCPFCHIAVREGLLLSATTFISGQEIKRSCEDTTRDSNSV